MGWKGGGEDTKLAATFFIQSDICAEICLTVGEKKKKKKSADRRETFHQDISELQTDCCNFT